MFSNLTYLVSTVDEEAEKEEVTSREDNSTLEESEKGREEGEDDIQDASVAPGAWEMTRGNTNKVLAIDEAQSTRTACTG